MFGHDGRDVVHILPPSYDAWRTTPPWDRDRPAWTPDSVETPLLIEAGEIQIDATGTYDGDTGTLLSVRINRREIAVHQIAQAMQLLGEDRCPWADDLDAHALAELCEQAARDREDDRGDWLRDQKDGEAA